MKDDEDYTPATRPDDAPERVRFEREGDHEQLLIGGGAQGIEESILRSTGRNLNIIGWTVMGVRDLVGNLGDGTLQELTFMMMKDNERRDVTISGLGMRVKFE